MRLPFPALALTLALSLAVPVHAQETRVAADDHVPPPAQIAQLAWLAGSWSGSGIDGAPAHESWLPPTGNTMVGKAGCRPRVTRWSACSCRRMGKAA